MALPTQARLRQLFRYDRKGALVRIVRQGQRGQVGQSTLDIAPDKAGYVRVGVDGRQYLVHWLIWVFHRGDTNHPAELDHKDRNKGNNRIGNLRPANRGQNCQNSTKRRDGKTSRHVGVYHSKSEGKWKAQIQAGGVRWGLGTFATEEGALLARVAAAKKLHGQFSTHRNGLLK